MDHDWYGYDVNIGTPRIDKWDYENGELDNIMTLEETSSNNGTKGNPTLQADLIGDWREEVMVRDIDSTELRIYTTTDLTEHRFPTLMHDPVYRLGIAWQNVAYNQPPHTSYYLGSDMEEAPEPNIDLVVPSNVDVKPGTLNVKSKGKMTVKVQVPANAVDLVDRTTAELKVNGQAVSGKVKNSKNGYKIKVERRDFISALGSQTGEVIVKVSATSDSGDIFVGVDTIRVK